MASFEAAPTAVDPLPAPQRREEAASSLETAEGTRLAASAAAVNDHTTQRPQDTRTQKNIKDTEDDEK